jgi:methylated-DNA-[protein]-cysteine S-methyltransferase
MQHYHNKIQTPVGELKLIVNDNGLAAILWENDDPARVKIPEGTAQPEHPLLLETAQQLAEYFDGKRTGFTIPLDFSGTPFQKKVWAILLTIPFGKTRSYGDIAREIGDIKTVRAVGAANGKNPISIIAPCHRVVGASGKLVGFAGGLANKSILLQLESAATAPTLW